MLYEDKNLFNNQFNEAIDLIFEADEETNVEDSAENNDQENTSNIEIAPPPEESETKNSETFLNNKVTNSFIDNDPAIHNLVEIISEDMMDQDSLKPYVDIFFTKLGINDISPDQFKIFSGEIWNKLDEMSEMDATASLATFNSWVREKIQQYQNK